MSLGFWLTGGGVAILGLVIWWALRSARREGEASQRADDIALGADAESAMHDIQAEERDTEETRRRMREGGF